MSDQAARIDVTEIAATLGIKGGGKLAYLESCLNAEWWRGHQAGLIKATEDTRRSQAAHAVESLL